jgi:hypothetical protein
VAYGGGGLATSGGTTTLTNTIVAMNTRGTGGAATPDDISTYGGGAVSSSSANNLIGTGGLGGLTNINGNEIGIADPGLAPLGSYGGPTQTMALLPGSPAIGAGIVVDDAQGHPITTDQRGMPLDSPSPDIGAFQSQGFTLTPVGGSTPQATVAGMAFANPLAVIVTPNNPVEPVNGGVITVAAKPAGNGASATLFASSAVIANGQASVMATANWIVGSYTVTASATGATPASFHLANTYKIAAMFDQSQPHQSGSTIPVKIEVTDALGNNVGSASLPVTALSVVGPDGQLQSPGNSQPGNLFTFDPTTGTYQFNVKAKGYKPGTYTLSFTVGDDTLYSVSFVIR